ncbi:MAG: helix-turn-helix domain-containing protein [Bradyrhizobiaceae bacterium]|nr:helix-turn-helix domain-containing protein [Bradyrhizobiaceae bacterium]
MAATQRVWSTEQAPPGAALKYWTEAICEAFLEMQAGSPSPADFAARLEQRPFGPIDLNFADTTAQEVRRTPQAITRSRKHNFYLLYMREGRLRVRQRNRAATVTPGDCVLVDSKEPYAFSFPETNRCLSVQIPQDWLCRWLPAPEDSTAIPFRTHSQWGATLVSAIGNLAETDPGDLALPSSVVADQIGALLALTAGPAPAVRPHQRAMIRRIRETMWGRLHDPSLNPQAVAAAHGISRRYLHLLFASSGMSYGATLIALRLEAARRLLDDPRFAGVSVAEIAWRCGFIEPSHFARRFRARYGTAPATYRKALHS